MRPKDADGLANSVNTDQTAPLSVRKFRNIMVNAMHFILVTHPRYNSNYYYFISPPYLENKAMYFDQYWSGIDDDKKSNRVVRSFNNRANALDVRILFLHNILKKKEADFYHYQA